MSVNEVFEIIQTRRSTRVFQDRPLDEETLNCLLEAGRYAPSGGNSQTTHFIVIENKEVLKKLAELAEQEFAKMEVTPDMYRSMASSVMRSKAGGYVFHYNAPVLILTANLADYSNNIADCACALENMMIMGSALDIGTCWINQLKWLNEDPVITECLRELGLKENERVYGALIAGYPASEDGRPARTPLPRTGNPVTRVR